MIFEADVPSNMKERIRKIISQVKENESIAVRLCGEDGMEKYIITRVNNISPRKYKLYTFDSEIMMFTGKTALSPLDLEESVSA